MEPIKGLIALDIDGTITAKRHEVDKEVVDFLNALYSKSFILMFLTGRSYKYAESVLKDLTFPFLFATENGAELIAMPDKKIFKKHYIPKKEVIRIAKIFEHHGQDPLVYSGKEKGDFCYYRPNYFSTEMKIYLNELQQLTPGAWVRLNHFEEMEQADVPMLKGVGSEKELRPIYEELLKDKTVNPKLIHDPIRNKGKYLLVNAALATKGNIVQEFRSILEKEHSQRLYLIAGGDDFNDLEMLEVADFSIALGQAPDEVKARATFVAPPASENGIIQGLNEAIQHINT
jgi:hypothetical protein